MAEIGAQRLQSFLIHNKGQKSRATKERNKQQIKSFSQVIPEHWEKKISATELAQIKQVLSHVRQDLSSIDSTIL